MARTPKRLIANFKTLALAVHIRIDRKREGRGKSTLTHLTQVGRRLTAADLVAFTCVFNDVLAQRVVPCALAVQSDVREVLDIDKTIARMLADFEDDREAVRKMRRFIFVATLLTCYISAPDLARFFWAFRFGQLARRLPTLSNNACSIVMMNTFQEAKLNTVNAKNHKLFMTLSPRCQCSFMKIRGRRRETISIMLPPRKPSKQRGWLCSCCGLQADEQAALLEHCAAHQVFRGAGCERCNRRRCACPPAQPVRSPFMRARRPQQRQIQVPIWVARGTLDPCAGDCGDLLDAPPRWLVLPKEASPPLQLQGVRRYSSMSLPLCQSSGLIAAAAHAVDRGLHCAEGFLLEVAKEMKAYMGEVGMSRANRSLLAHGRLCWDWEWLSEHAPTQDHIDAFTGVLSALLPLLHRTYWPPFPEVARRWDTDAVRQEYVALVDKVRAAAQREPYRTSWRPVIGYNVVGVRWGIEEKTIAKLFNGVTSSIAQQLLARVRCA